MYTKSIIQQNVENLKAKNNFRTAMESLMDKYTIEDSVFIADKSGNIFEATMGYFVVDNEYNNIQEAISSCNINNMCVRIINNEKFQVGTLNMSLNECDKTKNVFDLSRLENVR